MPANLIRIWLVWGFYVWASIGEVWVLFTSTWAWQHRSPPSRSRTSAVPRLAEQARPCLILQAERLFSSVLCVASFSLHVLSFFLPFLNPFIVKMHEHREIPPSKMYPLDKKWHSSVKCTEIHGLRHRFNLCLYKMLVSPCTIQCSVKSCKDQLSHECFRKLKSRRKTVAAKCA